MLRVLPGSRIALDATALLCLVGAPASRAVTWTASSGTVEPINTYTDANGRAFALWTPAEEGAATLGASFGA